EVPNHVCVDWLHYVVASLFVILGAGCVISMVLSLPGTWIMLAVAIVIELADGWYRSGDSPITFGWWVLGISAALAALGELFEFLAGAAGAKGGGGTRRGMIGAIVGGVLGAIIFTFAVPILFVGTLLGALVGTFVGAMVGEISAEQPRSLRGSLKPATGATIGRALGTAGKIGAAVVMWVLLSVAAFVP
ncbi:MAG TPA: DUF456 domain-containing protein, partial [Phycisphaerales bacterium]|nr:DUF456 domain-containing protein [Phycisphaerales bacterium]